LSQLMAQFFGVNYNKMAEPVLKNDEHVDFDSNLWDWLFYRSIKERAL